MFAQYRIILIMNLSSSTINSGKIFSILSTIKFYILAFKINSTLFLFLHFAYFFFFSLFDFSRLLSLSGCCCQPVSLCVHVCEKKIVCDRENIHGCSSGSENRVEKKHRVGMCLKVVKQFFLFFVFFFIRLCCVVVFMCTLSTQLRLYTQTSGVFEKEPSRLFFSFLPSFALRVVLCCDVPFRVV